MGLLNTPIMQFADADGTPLRFARAYFYRTGTTEPLDVYADADFDEVHTHPVVADSQGIFPAIFFKDEEILRMKLTRAEGDVAIPLLDVDPVNQLFTVYAPNIADGAIEEKLGYTPVDPANAVFSNNPRMAFEATELNPDDMGYRGNPPSIRNLDHTFELNESQGLVIKDAAQEVLWTIPSNVFPLGHYIYVANRNSGQIDLTTEPGVTVRTDGSPDAGDLVLPPYYQGRLTQVASNDWVLSPAPSTTADQSLTQEGYIEFPGGYIRQWGRYTGAKQGDSKQLVNFSKPFPNACFGVNVTAIQANAPAGADMAANLDSYNKDGATIYVAGIPEQTISGFVWEAWGH